MFRLDDTSAYAGVYKGGKGASAKHNWEDVPSDEGGTNSNGEFCFGDSDGGEAITDGVTARRTLELINAIVLSALRKEEVAMPVDRDRYDELMEELKRGEDAGG